MKAHPSTAQHIPAPNWYWWCCKSCFVNIDSKQGRACQERKFTFLGLPDFVFFIKQLVAEFPTFFLMTTKSGKKTLSIILAAINLNSHRNMLYCSPQLSKGGQSSCPAWNSVSTPFPWAVGCHYHLHPICHYLFTSKEQWRLLWRHISRYTLRSRNDPFPPQKQPWLTPHRLLSPRWF